MMVCIYKGVSFKISPSSPKALSRTKKKFKIIFIINTFNFNVLAKKPRKK